MSYRRLTTRDLLPGLWLIVLILVALPGRAQAATFLVANTNDAGPGSLRTAIARANNNSGTDAIDFASGLGGRITLTSGQLRITDDLTINGPGAGVIAVSGNNSSRVFEIGPEATVSISGLTITEGFIPPPVVDSEGGAGVLNFGSLAITDTVVTANHTMAQDTSGGGIENSGSLSVTNSLISGNSADRAGGGIGNNAFVNQASVRVIDSRVIGNTAGESGGGIRNTVGDGIVLVQNSIVKGNSAEDYGGITGGNITIRGSSINRNSGLFAGAVALSGSSTISNSRIIGNRGDFAIQYTGISPSDSLVISNSVINENARGGLVNYAGSVVLRNNTRVTNNSASGIVIFGDDDVPTTVTVRSSTISGNEAADMGGGIKGGGINNQGESSTVHLISSTVADNTAETGGGVYNRGTLTLQSSTITRNTATGGPGSGGGVFNDGGTVTLDANSSVTNNVPDDCVGC